MHFQAENIFKSFGDNQVLRGVDLEVSKSESLVILGGSGAGKSVLIRHLAGLMSPDQGRVLINDQDLAQFSREDMMSFRQKIGFSFQEGALFDSMTAFENVAFPIRRHNRRIKEAELRDRVAHCLELVGLPSVGDRLPAQLSGGMRRRVGFARAIALEPEVLFFDEPTSGLDPIMTSLINKVIISLREKLHAATVTITHDLVSARDIATRTAMLFNGRVIHQDEGQAFFQAQDPVVRQFIEGRAEGPATSVLYR